MKWMTTGIVDGISFTNGQSFIKKRRGNVHEKQTHYLLFVLDFRQTDTQLVFVLCWSLDQIKHILCTSGLAHVKGEKRIFP